MNFLKWTSTMTCRNLSVCVLGILIAGCASTERYHFTNEAGQERQNAVRNIMAQQVLDQDASRRHAGQMPGAEDGSRAVNTLQDYRGDGGSSEAGASSGSGSGASGVLDALDGLQGLL